MEMAANKTLMNKTAEKELCGQTVVLDLWFQDGTHSQIARWLLQGGLQRRHFPLFLPHRRPRRLLYTLSSPLSDSTARTQCHQILSTCALCFQVAPHPLFAGSLSRSSTPIEPRGAYGRASSACAPAGMSAFPAFESTNSADH